MRNVLLGKTGLRISSLCMGTMAFGDASDEATSEAMFRRCREAGVNAFDCANVYSAGRAEEILGRLIRSERDQLIVISKVGFPMGRDENDRGLSRRHVLASVEASLRRLDTDRLDILFLHRFDEDVPMEETLRAVDLLAQQGKVLYVGVSNWAAWQTAKAMGLSDRLSLMPVSCVQPMYNLVKRQAEVEILPLAASERLGVLTYSPLGGGLLSGKYGMDRKPEHGRLVDNAMYASRYGGTEPVQTATDLHALACEYGVSTATMAVAWVMAHPAVTAPIMGARNVDQLEASLAAAEFSMSADLYAQIAALSATPPPATDRSEEQQGMTYKGSGETYR